MPRKSSKPTATGTRIIRNTRLLTHAPLHIDYITMRKNVIISHADRGGSKAVNERVIPVYKSDFILQPHVSIDKKNNYYRIPSYNNIRYVLMYMGSNNMVMCRKNRQSVKVKDTLFCSRK